jgi:hypothetical protein
MIIGMFIYAAISILMGFYSIYKKKGIWLSSLSLWVWLLLP